jgi:cytochrome c-type biogenesis protein CcmH
VKQVMLWLLLTWRTNTSSRGRSVTEGNGLSMTRPLGRNSTMLGRFKTGPYAKNQIHLIVGLILASLLVTQLAWAVDSAPEFADAQLQARYEVLTHQLRCLVCQNETIADSNATLAGDLRRELREQLVAGSSDAEVLKFMTDRYGAFVLYKPPFEARTWILWLGPLAFLLIGVGVALRIILRRAKLAELHPDQDPSESV